MTVMVPVERLAREQGLRTPKIAGPQNSCCPTITFDQGNLDSTMEQIKARLAHGRTHRHHIVPIDAPAGWAEEFIAEIRAGRDSR